LQHNGFELTCALRFVSALTMFDSWPLLAARTAARQVERIVRAQRENQPGGIACDHRSNPFSEK